MALKSKSEIAVIKKEEQTPAPIVESDILKVDVGMDTKIEIATNVANQLKDILEKQNMIDMIGDKPYVSAEGWNALGTILGTFARTEEVAPVDFTQSRYAYRARVSIMQGEHVLATAEAIATSGGFQKEEHQVYSMAQTRAMGKAYRMAFSWIMKFAGYEVTPAEEMEEKKENYDKLQETEETPKEDKKTESKSKTTTKKTTASKKTKAVIDVDPKDIEVVQ